jgi:hypothetical protein
MATIVPPFVAAGRSSVTPTELIAFGVGALLLGSFFLVLFLANRRPETPAPEYSGPRTFIAGMGVVVGIVLLVIGIFRSLR